LIRIHLHVTIKTSEGVRLKVRIFYKKGGIMMKKKLAFALMLGVLAGFALQGTTVTHTAGGNTADPSQIISNIK
jgi:hypothetical protein